MKINRIPHWECCNLEEMVVVVVVGNDDDDDDAVDFDFDFDANNDDKDKEGRGTNSSLDDFSTSHWMESPMSDGGASPICMIGACGYFQRHSNSLARFWEVAYMVVIIVFSDPSGPRNVASRNQCKYFNCDSFCNVWCNILYPINNSLCSSCSACPGLVEYSSPPNFGYIVIFPSAGYIVIFRSAGYSYIVIFPSKIIKNVAANNIKESEKNSSDKRNRDFVDTDDDDVSECGGGGGGGDGDGDDDGFVMMMLIN